jgi:hypothetical protein
VRLQLDEDPAANSDDDSDSGLEDEQDESVFEASSTARLQLQAHIEDD